MTGEGPALALEVVEPVPATRRVLVRVGGRPFGWLAVCLAAYLPAMFLVTRFLRLP